MWVALREDIWIFPFFNKSRLIRLKRFRYFVEGELVLFFQSLIII